MTNGIIDSGQEIVTNGLVLHLDVAQRRSYSGTGTNWRDLISGTNATLTNGAVFNSSNGGNVSFDGVDDYVDTNRDIQFGATSSFSLESYFYLNSYVNSQLINNESGGYNGYQLSVTGAQQNTIFFSLRVAPGNNIGVNFVINSPVQKWTHVLLTYNGSGVASGVKLYADGVLITGVVVSDNLSGTINSGTTTRLGRRVPPSYGFLNGKIGLTRIYNRELSATEVLQNYNAIKARFEVPALLDLYPNAAAAYSLRKLRSGYTGSAIRVRRSSDNTEQDIGFTSTGDLDTTALTTFVGANNGFVSTWYDQSGNNRNATQTTQANQPIVVSGGTTITENNKPVIYANNRTKRMNIPSFTLVGDYSIVIASTLKSFGRNMWMGTLGLSGYVRALDTQTQGFSIRHNGEVGGANFSGVQSLTPELHVFQRFGTNISYSRNSVNNITTELSPQGTNFTISVLFDGYNDGIGYLMDANAFEFIIYNSNQSTKRIGIETNINSYYGIYNPTVVTIDTDAQAFITAAGITDLVQQGAINTLVKTLKDVNLWTKMKAIYPFVGGTATSHKFNLKDPRDVDGAFRLVFSGGWTHSATGAKPDGSTGYADSFLTPATSLLLNNIHLSYYSRTSAQGLYVEIGSRQTIPTPATIVDLDISYNGLFYTTIIGINNINTANTNTVGYFITTRTNSTTLKAYRNNSVFLSSTNSNSGTNLPNSKIFVGARSLNNAVDIYTLRECAFATIGDGLTDTEAANLYSAVQTFQTTLGRQV